MADFGPNNVKRLIKIKAERRMKICMGLNVVHPFPSVYGGELRALCRQNRRERCGLGWAWGK